MAKWCCVIGFARDEEVSPGVHEEKFDEYTYYGDMTYNSRGLQQSGNLNDNVTINNKLSIVADPFARKHFHEMRYVRFMDAKWKIVSVEVQHPRLVLSLGEVYNA